MITWGITNFDKKEIWIKVNDKFSESVITLDLKDAEGLAKDILNELDKIGEPQL